MATTKADRYNASQWQSGKIGFSYLSELVEAFQKYTEIAVDGEAGPETCALLAQRLKDRVPDPPTFPTYPTVSSWTDLLNKYRGGIALEYLQLWIKEESGGNNLALGIPRVEAGIFQTYHPDDDHYGATYAQLRVNGKDGSPTPVRALTNVEAELQVKAGIAYVANAIAVSNQQVKINGLSWNLTTDVYLLAKLRHGLPIFGTTFLPYYATKVVSGTKSFDGFASWIRALSLHDFASIAPSAVNFYDARDRILKNAEACKIS